MGEQSNVKPTTTFPLLSQAFKEPLTQTRALCDWKQTRVVGDDELQVETGLAEWLQPFTEGLTRGIVNFDRRLSS